MGEEEGRTRTTAVELKRNGQLREFIWIRRGLNLLLDRLQGKWQDSRSRLGLLAKQLSG